MVRLKRIISLITASVLLFLIGYSAKAGDGTSAADSAKDKLRKGVVTRMKTKFNPKGGNYDYSALEMIAVIKDSENNKEYESKPLEEPLRSGKEIWFRVNDDNTVEIVDKRKVSGFPASSN